MIINPALAVPNVTLAVPNVTLAVPNVTLAVTNVAVFLMGKGWFEDFAISRPHILAI
jgi:hypothetical protein